MNSKRSPSRIIFLVFLYLFLGLMALVFILPVWHVIMASFSEAKVLATHTGLVGVHL